jgi:hypothetical protein
MAIAAVCSGFAVPAATGNQSITFPVANTGTPTLIIFMGNQLTNSGVGANASWSFSFFKDDLNVQSGTQSYADADAVATTANAKLSAINHHLEQTNTGASATLYQQAWVSFDSNGFTQNWNQVTSGALVGYLALAGADKKNTKTNQFTANTVAGKQQITGVGFKPDLLILYCSERTTNGSSTGLFHSFGAGDSAGNRWVISAEAVNGATMTSTSIIRTGQRTDNIIQNLTTAPGTDSLADLVSLDPDGFTINWSTAPASAWLVNYVAIKGPGLRVGNFTKTTTAAPATQLVSVGVQPKGIILVSFEAVAGTALNNDLRQAWGMSDGTRQFCLSNHAVTASINTVSKSLINFDKTLKFLTAPATIDAQAKASFVNGQLQLVWDINNATAAQILYIAFGDNHQGPETIIRQHMKRKAYY